MKRVAGRATSAFRQHKYAEARDLYTEALQQATKHGHKSSAIALILRNRASCHRELKNNDLALQDAQDAINNDPAYLKGYNKAGDLAKQMGLVNEALGYFRDGYLKAVEQDKDPLTFLVHIVEVIPNVEDVQVEMILRPVQPVRRLRTKLVERLVAEEKWHLVHAVFYRGGGGYQSHSGGIATGCDTSKINVAPLLQCYRTYQPPFVHGADIICALLRHGSGLESFSLGDGDTPIHALLWVELMKEESLPVMTLICTELRARFKDQLKALDAKGNTLLHFAAMSGKGCHSALMASELLIDAGVDPNVKNADGKTAIHYAHGGSELSNYLRNRRDEARGAPRRVPKPLTTQTSPSSQRTSKAKAKNTEAPMRDEHRLEIFARTISEAKLQDVGDMTEEHQRCLEGIVSVIDTPKVEVVPTTVVVQAPPSVWRHTVEKLSSQKKWRTLGMLLTGGGNNYNTGDGGLAAGCDTTCVPLLQVLNFFETKMAKQSRLMVHSVIRELLKGGTSPDGDASDNHPIGHCLRKKDFVSVQMLLEHGAKFSKLARKEGDALLCAAVQMANKGNSGILNLLLNRKEIDHRARDSNGNNLLHIAVKEKNSTESANFIKHLHDIGVDSSEKNKKGMTPLDYLKQEDGRRQILEPPMKKEEETTNKNGTNRNIEVTSKGTDHNDDNDLTRHHGDKTGDSSEEKPAIHETKGLKQSTDHKDDKDLTRTRGDKTGDSSKEKPAIHETEGLSRGKGQNLSSAQKETTELFVESILRSISKIPLPEGEKTEERLLRLVRQRQTCCQTTNRITNSEQCKEQVKLEERKANKKPEDEQSLCSVGLGGKSPPSRSDYKEDEELPDTSMDVSGNIWEVECCEKVMKILTKDKKMPLDLKKRVFEKVNRLAKGEWTNELKQTVVGRPKQEGMKLFEAKVDKATRILWELTIALSQHSRVDPMKWSKGVRESAMEASESTSAVYTEIIRLWDIVLDHDNLKRAIDQAVTSFKSITPRPIPKKSLIKVTDHNVTQESSTRRPTRFHKKKNIAMNSGGSPIEQQFSVVGSNIPKFYSSSASLVNTALGDITVPVEFPFRVNESEHAIVHLRANPPKSILLLGRSGTGKTTCCLYRLWNAFVAYWTESAASGFQPWGYLSVESKTIRDHMEASKSKEQACIRMKEETNIEERSDQRPDNSEIKGNSVVKKAEHEDESLHARMLKREENSKVPETTENPETAKELFEHLHQIFVTKNAILCTEVREQFRRFCNAEKAAQVHLEATQHDGKIPARLQDVDPVGFPLFLNSKQWLLMLDASLEGTSFFKRTRDGHLAEEVPGWMNNDGNTGLVLESNSFENEASTEESEDAGKRQHKRLTMRREVTYEVFYTELWERVNRAKEDYHPTLVWMEIMSIIKGSFEAVETELGFLSHEEYLQIGKKQAEFTGDRDKIYDIFLAYQHEKRQRHMFDEMDFVHNLYKRLALAEDVDWSIHQVYVDETQDFTQAELALLIRCCRDPNEMFFTGDTAQSIMRGVSFRFKDLRSLFHKARESLQQMGKRTAVQVPDMHYLKHNYRSCSGIINLAAGVIDLLTTFFPHSFDTLPKDKGRMDGPKPLLLQRCSQEDLYLLLTGHNKLDFGANQVVLVANSEAKVPDVFRGSLVLTIEESKGLEFDDVLLYNIFKDSQANEEWRVVLNWREEGDAFSRRCQLNSERSELVYDSDQSSTVAQTRPLDFNPEMHKILNSELKYLYTAITRARVNVWIFDEDTTKHAPMFKYFLGRRLVDEPQRDEQGQLSCDVFAKTSTPDEWCQRGEYYYKMERWELAAFSFEKGGDQRRAIMTMSHHLALQASQGATTTKEKHRIRQKFLESADLFLQSGNHVDDREVQHSVAIGLCNSGHFNLAAQLFERLGEFSNAAKMYTKANEKIQASRCFLQAGNFHDAVNSLKSVHRFESAADLCMQYIDLETRCKQEGLDPTVVMTAPIHTPDSLLLEATIHYHKHGYEEKIASCLKRLTVDTRLICLKNIGRVNEAVTLLKEEGRGQEAAELLRSVGEFEEAAKTTDQDQNPQFVAECLLIQSRKKMKIATVDIEENKGILRRCMDLFQKCGNNEGRAEAIMMLGDLTDAESMLQDALKLFGANVSTGATEAAILLIGKKTILALEDIRLILAALEEFFGLIRALLLDRDHSVKEQQWLRTCELFYGVKCSEVGTATFSPSEEPRILDVFNRELPGRSVTKMKIHHAREYMARDLLRNLGQINVKLTEMLHSIATRSRVCHMYTAGLSCPKGDACAYLHHPYDKDTLNSLLQATIFLMKFRGIIDLGCEKIKDSNWERVQLAVDALRSRGAGKTSPCDDLYDVLFPTNCHQRILTENVSSAKEVFRMFQGDAVVTSCIRNYSKSLWKSASRSDKRSNTDLLIKIANLFRLAKDPPDNFSRLLANAEEDFTKWTMKRKRPEKIPLHVGMICSIDDPDTPLFVSFMRRLEEFVQDIYERENALSSLDNLKAFMRFLAKRALEPLMPSFANTCFFMELLTVICYSIYAKRNQHELLCLPASYISMVHLCDRLWGVGKGSICSAIERLPYKNDEILRKVNSCIWFIIDIICQRTRFPHFNVIDDVFRPNIPDYAESGEMERVFILAAVLLCGCGGPVPKDAEIPLREALYKIDIKRHFPQRLTGAIREMRTAKGIRDVVMLLRDLLQARDQENLQHCCWKYPDRMTKGVYRGLNFEQVKPDLFIRGFWRNIMIEFLSDHHDDDFETQADNSASTNGQNDACKTSSDDVLIPEGSVGIVEIEASQAEEEGKAYQSNDDFIAEGEFEDKEEEEELVDDEIHDADDQTLAEGMYERISQQQAEERRQAAAYKIQTFWRAHRKIQSTEIEPELSYMTSGIERQMSVEYDDLREYRLDDTGCRICGVTFGSRLYIRDDAEEQEEDQERKEDWDADPDGMKAEEEDVDERDIITRERHSQHPIHLKNVAEFNDFKGFYITDVIRVQEKFNKFMREVRINKEGVAMVEIQKVHIANDSFRSVLEKIKYGCAWNKLGDASRALAELEKALAAFHTANGLLVLNRDSIEEGASAPMVDVIPVALTETGQQAKDKSGKGGRQRKKNKIRKSIL